MARSPTPAKKSPSKKPTAKKAATKKAAPKAASAKAGAPKARGKGTRESPWTLSTPSGGSSFTAFRDDTLDPPALVVKVGSTELRYHLRALDDLHAMLKARGDQMRAK